MSLRPGMVKINGSPDHSFPPAPADMPRDPVAAQAPLYQPSAKSTRSLPEVMRGPNPGSKYIKTGVAEFSLPLTEEAALAWYRSAMSACAYKLQYYRPLQGGYATIQYSSPTIPSLTISVSLKPVSSTRSIVVLFAAVISGPPRPSSSLITGSLRSVRINYVLPDGRSEYSVTITYRWSLMFLATAVSASHTVDTVLHGCVNNPVGGTALFTRSNGSTSKVTFLPGCGDLLVGNGPPIVDVGGAARYAAGLVAYRFCSSHTCTKLPT